MKQPTNKNRIWELDVFRGILILGVVIIHSLYFICEFNGTSGINNSLYNFIADRGGGLFVLLSGICVTLGHHPVRRGLILVPIALVITAASYFVDPNMTITFGVIHLLSVCMILAPVLCMIPNIFLCICGLLILYIGLFTELPHVKTHMLVPLGYYYYGFSTYDYFPLIPNLGYFMLGILLGKTVYRDHKSKIPYPKVLAPVNNFLTWCGQHSLWIYLIQPPLMFGILTLIQTLQ